MRENCLCLSPLFLASLLVTLHWIYACVWNNSFFFSILFEIFQLEIEKLFSFCRFSWKPFPCHNKHCLDFCYLFARTKGIRTHKNVKLEFFGGIDFLPKRQNSSKQAKIRDGNWYLGSTGIGSNVSLFEWWFTETKPIWRHGILQ